MKQVVWDAEHETLVVSKKMMTKIKTRYGDRLTDQQIKRVIRDCADWLYIRPQCRSKRSNLTNRLWTFFMKAATWDERRSFQQGASGSEPLGAPSFKPETADQRYARLSREHRMRNGIR